jgi:hypothetical protein
VVREFLNRRTQLASVFPGLQQDPVPTVTMVLATHWARLL